MIYNTLFFRKTNETYMQKNNDLYILITAVWTSEVTKSVIVDKISKDLLCIQSISFEYPNLKAKTNN